MRDDDFEFGPKLWDATPGVCCAAFQLGACVHTESDLAQWDMAFEPDTELGAERVQAPDVPDEDEPF